MFELVENYTPSAKIKVIGVGGGGGNAVAQMIDAGIDGPLVVTMIRQFIEGSEESHDRCR